MNEPVSQLVRIDYTNWRGERRWRLIRPLSIAFENSEWHPDTQWILHAVDMESSQSREFALASVHAWIPTEVTPAEQTADIRP